MQFLSMFEGSRFHNSVYEFNMRAMMIQLNKAGYNFDVLTLQVRLKRERPGPSVCSNISSTNVQTLRKKCRSESPTPSNGSSDNNHFMLQRPPHSENSNNEPETCGFNIFKKYSTSSLASQAANTNTMCKTKVIDIYFSLVSLCQIVLHDHIYHILLNVYGAQKNLHCIPSS